MTNDNRTPDPNQHAAYSRMKKAFHNGDVQAFDEAMRLGDNPFYRHSDGETMLHYAIGQGKNSAAMIERLIDCGLDVDTPKNNGETAFLRAVLHSDVPAMRCLLRHGANPLAQLDNGFNAFHIHAHNSVLTIPQLLYRNGVDPDQPNKDGLTATEHFNSKGQGYAMDAFDDWRDRQDAVALPLQANKPVATLLTADGLFTRDDVSLASWQQLPVVLEKAKAQKLELPDEAVVNMAVNASNHGVLPQVINALNENGYRLGVNALAERDGQPTEALLQLAKNWDLSLVFNAQNLRGQSGGDVAAAYNALPEEHQTQVGNIHLLRLSCNTPNNGRGR